MTWTSHPIRPAAGVVASLPALLLLLGCSAHAPVSSLTTPAAARSVSHASLVERHESGGGDARKVDETLRRMETAYAAGQASLLAGDEEAAFDSFDEALEVVLRSDVDLDAYPEARDRAETLVASINGLAVEAAAAADPEEEAPEVPILDEQTDGVEAATLCCPDLTIPMVSHPAVDAMTRFYTGRAKERLELGLSRYGKYAPTVARILEEEGVPGELAWLALVESNYNAQAYSRARAKGLWQFISATGRRYGLKQDFWVDERSDFEKATRSAARYLRDLYGMFGDWHLALASYNAGEGKIGRAIKSTGRKDFWRIRETRYIRRETKDYVPAFLAVVSIVRNPAAHGIDFRPAPALQWDVTTVRSCTDLAVIAQCAGTTLEAIQDLNPELRRGTTPGGDQPYALRIPRGSQTVFAERYAALPPEQLLTWHRHVVQRGETVGRIAERYGTSAGAVMAANRLGSSTAIAPGQALLIPAGASVHAVPEAVLASRAPRGAADPEPSSSGSHRISYRVRPGDTLGKIAARHGTTISRIAEWNGLRNTNRIHVGQRLTLYGKGGAPSGGGSARSSSTRSASYHVVRPGDTLSSIAKRHGVSVAQLRRLNGLGGSSMIRPGQRLKVSSSGRSASADVPGSQETRSDAPVRTAAFNPGGPMPVAQ